MIMVQIDYKSYSRYQRTDVSVKVKNLNQKEIKYCTLRFTPYNAVGDVVTCRYTKHSAVNLQIIGPIKQDSICDITFDNIWYVDIISTIKLNKVSIEYMDGTKKTIKGEDVQPIYYPPAPTPAPTTVSTTSGCYIATCVYGSYDCPQVWTLRRYRDNTLAKTWYGRTFIKTYYAISPTIVKWFGETKWFKNVWRKKLDRIIEKLESTEK